MSEDDLSIEALLEYFNGVESGIVSARRLIAEKKGVAEFPDFDELAWVSLQGTKGPYQQANRKNSKVDIFDRLKAEIKAHKGFWQHQGWKYWFDRNDENTIDRRKV
jgi:hypothetical protein